MRIPVVLAISLAAGAAPSAAQEDTLARLDGTVSASNSGRPLSGVMISVRGTAAFYVTDSTGRFSLARLPAGRHTLRLDFQNRTSDDYDVVLRPGSTVELAILLDVGGVELAPVVVEAASSEWVLSLAGFYARRGKGFGRFVTRDEIERRNPAHLSGLLAGSGIAMRCTRMQQCVPTRVAAGRRCTVAVFIDGQRVEDYNIDMIPLQDVVGIEVYRLGADTPVEFSRWSASCGAILIWTKN